MVFGTAFRKIRSFVPSLNGLETRALMSAGIVAPPSAFLDARGMIPSGVVRKSPSFSKHYLGPQRANLNLVSASAILRPGRSLTLSAMTAKRINRYPLTSGVNDASFFVFGLNRGGPAAYAVFPERLGIRFDAVVVARLTPEGVSGYVLDIARGNIETEIEPDRIRVQGRTARITIPPDLPSPPEGALPSTRLRIAAWSRSRLEHGLADIDDFVASFVPENSTFRVRVAR